ncbi:MAG TPA: HAD family hydrolase [Candidatus Angelobacter sp.]|nr:HAD family hydrolase [Candidatus Angelobacter sp.]
MAKTKTETPAVLFDLDGTLIDSVYEHVEAWWTTLNNAGILVPKWKIHRRIGMSGKSFVTELLREFAPNKKVNIENLEKEHDRKFVESLSKIAPLRGADDLFRHLHSAKVRIAIATTGNRKQTSLLLKKLNVPPKTAILTGDDVKKAKPSPDIFVAAAQSLKIALSDCIVVGDSVWDLLAAGRKGALGVGMLSGGYGDEELQRAGAFRIYADPMDMLLHLEQLGLPGQ